MEKTFKVEKKRKSKFSLAHFRAQKTMVSHNKLKKNTHSLKVQNWHARKENLITVAKENLAILAIVGFYNAVSLCLQTEILLTFFNYLKHVV